MALTGGVRLPYPDAVTDTDLDTACHLADTVDRYITGLEIRLSKQTKAVGEAA